MNTMTFNPALVGDDPARTSPPDDWSAAEEARYYVDLAEAQERYFHQVKWLVRDTVIGKLPACKVLYKNHLQMLDAAELLEAITNEVDQKTQAKAMFGQLDQDTRADGWLAAEAMLDEFCQETAAFMAKKELS